MEREDTRVHQEAIRLNRFLALAGVGSRRKNDELILSGVVKINGRIVRELGVKVNPYKDRVTVNGQLVDKASECPCSGALTKVGETCVIVCSPYFSLA